MLLCCLLRCSSGFYHGGICNIISSFGTTGFGAGGGQSVVLFDMVRRVDILFRRLSEIEAVVYYLTAIVLALFVTTRPFRKEDTVFSAGNQAGAYSVTGTLQRRIIVAVQLFY